MCAPAPAVLPEPFDRIDWIGPLPGLDRTGRSSARAARRGRRARPPEAGLVRPPRRTRTPPEGPHPRPDHHQGRWRTCSATRMATPPPTPSRHQSAPSSSMTRSGTSGFLRPTRKSSTRHARRRTCTASPSRSWHGTPAWSSGPVRLSSRRSGFPIRPRTSAGHRYRVHVSSFGGRLHADRSARSTWPACFTYGGY